MTQDILCIIFKEFTLHSRRIIALHSLHRLGSVGLMNNLDLVSLDAREGAVAVAVLVDDGPVLHLGDGVHLGVLLEPHVLGLKGAPSVIDVYISGLMKLENFE